MSTETLWNANIVSTGSEKYSSKVENPYERITKTKELYNLYDFENKVDLVDKLIREFDIQKDKFREYISGYESIAAKSFSLVINDLLSAIKYIGLKSSNITVSLTNSPSLVFQIRDYFHFTKIRYEIFIDDDEEYVAYSVYDKNGLFARNSGKHSDIINPFKDTIKTPFKLYSATESGHFDSSWSTF